MANNFLFPSTAFLRGKVHFILWVCVRPRFTREQFHVVPETRNEAATKQQRRRVLQDFECMVSQIKTDIFGTSFVPAPDTEMFLAVIQFSSHTLKSKQCHSLFPGKKIGYFVTQTETPSFLTLILSRVTLLDK
ncbi:uncharacterized protein LOC144086094 [Stigmatopora argus]